MKRYIKVQTQFVARHKWADAPDEVAFLRNTHRHLFKVSVKISVEHNDREIEFFIFQNFVQEFTKKSENQMIGSCEQYGEALIEYIEQKYPNRFIEVEVSEDGENSAIITT